MLEHRLAKDPQSNKRIRVGLIGCNPDPSALSWGAMAHVPALNSLPEYEISAVCTSSAQTAAEAASAFNISHAFSDPVALAASSAVDLVAVTVRAPLHAQMVEAACAAGKPVFCEWPLGICTEEATATKAMADKAGVRTIVGLQGFANETMVYARDLIASGFIGRMTSVNLRIGQVNWGPFETQQHAYLANAGNGASLLHIATVQALSSLCACVGNFATISASISNQYPQVTILRSDKVIPFERGAVPEAFKPGDRAELARFMSEGGDADASIETIAKTSPDHIFLFGELENGAIASFTIQGGATRTPGVRLLIQGTEGDLLLTSHGSANLHRAELVLEGGRGQTLEVLPLPKMYKFSAATHLHGPALGVARVYRDISDAIGRGEGVLNDFNYGLYWHRMTDVIQEAARTGKSQSCT